VGDYYGHYEEAILHAGQECKVYETEGETAQAQLAWAKASTIIQGLADGIKDEALRARFLAGPQIQPVLLHAQREASPLPQDHAEQQER
jgi:hypothetical protein